MSSSRGLVNPPGNCNCQSRTGTRSLIHCDVPPPEARGGGRSAIQRAGPQLVLSGCARDNTGLVASLSQPMGVGGCEMKTIGYTCRSVVLTVFGPGFNSRRLHHATRGEWAVATRSPLAHGKPHPITRASPASPVSPWSCPGAPTFTLDLSPCVSVPCTICLAWAGGCLSWRGESGE